MQIACCLGFVSLKYGGEGRWSLTWMDMCGYVRHVKVEIVCEDGLAEPVVEATHRAARTGLRGDGRIYVGDVEREVRVQDEPASP